MHSPCAWRSERASATGDVAFRSLDGRAGLAVVDVVERRRFALPTPESVSPRAADADRFDPPVDRAVALATDRFDLPVFVAAFVRDERGRLVAEAAYDETAAAPAGRRVVELSGPVKCYLLVDGPVTLASEGDALTVAFGSTRRVLLGARSYHTRPTATVTTTADPADAMAAVSTFGSALKTRSPERAFPTLRGHPPALELGDELAVPAGVEPPETGVSLDLPPDLRYVLPAAPLAYYLGATLEPADSPRLVAGSAVDESLPDEPRAFEAAVERVLERTFLLDCVVRTDGLYPVDLRERAVLDERLDRELGALYDRPVADRLAAALDAPWDALADQVPRWQLAAHVAPRAGSLPVLPSLVADLALVRTAREGDPADSAAGRAVLRERRWGGTGDAGATPAGPDAAADRVVVPEAVDAVDRAWLADGLPVGATKAIPAAYRNALDRTPSDGDLRLAVVAADAGATERDRLEAVYGSRGDLPFDVTVHRRPTTDELAALFADDADLLHFVGHVGEEGIECADGSLDAAGLESVGVGAFVLNACRSAEQGIALVEAGAVGGVVTLDDVVDENAVGTGYELARLLNAGFSLGAAASVLRERSLAGAKYLVVGDGGAAVVQPNSGTPAVVRVRRLADAFEVVIDPHPNRISPLGNVYVPHLEGARRPALGSGRLPPVAVSRDELRRFLALENLPVVLDGEFTWSSELVDEGMPATG